MNIKLLRRIQKHILSEPRRLIMADWCVTEAAYGPTYPADDDKEVKFAECGTAACIGGWALILGTKHTVDFYVPNIFKQAQTILGLDKDQAHDLFIPSNWTYNAEYEKAKTPAARAKIAAKEIDSFIKTNLKTKRARKI